MLSVDVPRSLLLRVSEIDQFSDTRYRGRSQNFHLLALQEAESRILPRHYASFQEQSLFKKRKDFVKGKIEFLYCFERGLFLRVLAGSDQLLNTPESQRALEPFPLIYIVRLSRITK